MNLGQILAEVDQQYVPNTVPKDVKIRWVNAVQNMIYRDFPSGDATFPFTLQADQEMLGVPDDCELDMIRLIEIEGLNYVHVNLDDSNNGLYWTEVLGMVCVHPAPKTATNGMIYYRPRPKQMAADADVPTIHRDYHDLMVFGLAARVAKATHDVELANNFDADFQQLLAKARFDLNPPRRKTVNVVRTFV